MNINWLVLEPSWSVQSHKLMLIWISHQYNRQIQCWRLSSWMLIILCLFCHSVPYTNISVFHTSNRSIMSLSWWTARIWNWPKQKREQPRKVMKMRSGRLCRINGPLMHIITRLVTRDSPISLPSARGTGGSKTEKPQCSDVLFCLSLRCSLIQTFFSGGPHLI